MNDGKVTITRISELAGFDAAGKAQQNVVVQFMVDNHGPFSETFAKAGFDPLQAKAKLAEFAQKLKTIHT